MTPASTRTRDRWTEARTGPGLLCPRNGKRPHTNQGTCDAGPHEVLLTASSGRPSEDGTKSRGLISPCRHMFSVAPAEGLIPLVPTRDIEVHVSSLVSTLVPAGKRPPEDTRWRSSRASAPHNKTSRAADWRSPKSGDQEDDGRPGYPTRSRRPRETS